MGATGARAVKPGGRRLVADSERVDAAMPGRMNREQRRAMERLRRKEETRWGRRG